ncbi:MAG: serine/threonine protein kinase [Oscillatoria sp. SIO1A7]|nr:serine/threonine protein kinase [Oscillatoria sp. SIO1A7]
MPNSLYKRYFLEKKLAENAGRETWLAEDAGLDPPQKAIVKLLAFSPKLEWDEFKLFEREAKVLQNLDHPRIPKYRDYFSIDRDRGEGLCWFGLVQDYIPGTSLQEKIEEGDRFSAEQVKAIAAQLLEILIYLHGLDTPVLHRDIKPSNLILGADEQIYLVDFGAVADPTVVEGATFTVVGTAGYAPLEQFWGKAVPASDLYALGATLVHLVTGIEPASLPQNNLRIRFEDRVSLAPDFRRWLSRLLEPDLERRFSSATEALAALQDSSLLAIPKPDRSRIMLKKYPEKLSIVLPRNRFSWMDVVKLTLQAIATSFWIVFLLSPTAIGLTLSFLIFLLLMFSTLNLKILGFAVSLLIITIWAGTKSFPEARNARAKFNLKMMEVFSRAVLDFHRDVFSIRRRGLLLSNWILQGNPSQIKSIEAIPQEAIVIEYGDKFYKFGQQLTDSERNWLVQEIQAWLDERSNK